MSRKMKKIKGKKKKGLITKNMSFSKVLGKYPKTAEVLMGEGMYCIGCPMSNDETIEQGCSAHGINADKIVEKLNKIAVKKK